MNRETRTLLLATVGVILMVIVLFLDVLAHERQEPQHPTSRASADLEALRLTTGEITFAQTPLVMGVPRPDPLRDGRWWMVLRTKRGWERWDGPYLTSESCVNDITDAYAQQYPHWQFACAEEV